MAAGLTEWAVDPKERAKEAAKTRKLPPAKKAAYKKKRAREQLVRLFGDDARDPIAWRAHAWWADAATARRPLDPRRDGLFGHPWLRQPLLDGRVHLASTETSAVSTGHIEGAVRRGLDVAQALTTALS